MHDDNWAPKNDTTSGRQAGACPLIQDYSKNLLIGSGVLRDGMNVNKVSESQSVGSIDLQPPTDFVGPGKRTWATLLGGLRCNTRAIGLCRFESSPCCRLNSGLLPMHRQRTYPSQRCSCPSTPSCWPLHRSDRCSLMVRTADPTVPSQEARANTELVCGRREVLFGCCRGV